MAGLVPVLGEPGKTGALIRVESPFPEYAVPRIWIWTEQFRRRVADDFGPKTLDEFVADWQASRDRGRRTWAVYRDGELGGLVTFDPWSPMVGTTHCLFARRFWGHETTLPALRAAYQQIFDVTGVQKLLSFAFADNRQLGVIAHRLGARTEGVLRQQTMRGGKPVDMVLFGLLREEFDANRSGGNAVDHGGVDRGRDRGRGAGESQERPDADGRPDAEDQRERHDAAAVAA